MSAGCPACGFLNTGDAVFCGRCGGVLGPTCSACGAGPLAPGIVFCTTCGAELARSAVALERKVVSVVFVDVVGFTSMSEALDPEDVRRVLDPYYLRAREELERYGGTVEKFIGDAVMALFGSPVSHEDDPERAVRAAYAVREAVHGLASGDDTPALKVRIGITTGEAVVDVNARPDEGKATAHGDVVNSAARLQAGRAGGCDPGRRAHVPGHALSDRLPLGAAAAREGQGAAAAGVVGRHPARPHGHRPVSSRPAAGRARARDPGAGRRPGRGPVGGRAPDGDAGRPAGHRQVAPGVGALPARRAERRHGLLAAGQVAALRRRRHLLGAGRDHQGPRRHPRDRSRRDRRGEAADRGRGRRRGRQRGALDRGAPVAPGRAHNGPRATRRPPHRGVHGLAPVPRGDRGPEPARPGLRGHALGRRQPARVHRRITSAAASRAVCWCSSPAVPS